MVKNNAAQIARIRELARGKSKAVLASIMRQALKETFLNNFDNFPVNSIGKLGLDKLIERFKIVEKKIDLQSAGAIDTTTVEAKNDQQKFMRSIKVLSRILNDFRPYPAAEEVPIIRPIFANGFSALNLYIHTNNVAEEKLRKLKNPDAQNDKNNVPGKPVDNLSSGSKR